MDKKEVLDTFLCNHLMKARLSILTSLKSCPITALPLKSGAGYLGNNFD